MRKILLYLLFLASSPALALDERHTELVGMSLGVTADEMVDYLIHKGFQPVSDRDLSGRVAGLEVWATVGAGKRDSMTCDYVLLTTMEQQGYNDYTTLMHWMQKHYGWPDWEGRVRSQRFARWFVGFDRDIVMIATASKAVEIWFFDNHEKRNLDYYSILKYCERHPARGVPHLTARECVVWKSVRPAPEVGKQGRHLRGGKKARRGRHAGKRHRRRR